MTNLEQAIRERAYHLWVAEGCCEGGADKHWLAAEREMLAARLHATAATTDAAPRTSEPAPATTLKPKSRRGARRAA